MEFPPMCGSVAPSFPPVISSNSLNDAPSRSYKAVLEGSLGLLALCSFTLCEDYDCSARRDCADLKEFLVLAAVLDKFAVCCFCFILEQGAGIVGRFWGMMIIPKEDLNWKCSSGIGFIFHMYLGLVGFS